MFLELVILVRTRILTVLLPSVALAHSPRARWVPGPIYYLSLLLGLQNRANRTLGLLCNTPSARGLACPFITVQQRGLPSRTTLYTLAPAAGSDTTTAYSSCPALTRTHLLCSLDLLTEDVVT